MISIDIKDFKNITTRKTFKFKVGELCHLIGSSGSGKTTILSAVEWCLYGKNNGIKSKSVKNAIPEVKLTLQDGTVIDRVSNDLTVITPENKKLTLDAAQGYIFTKLGSKEVWKSMSYLEQGIRNSILIGSSEEKMSIFRELVYGYGLTEENDPDYYLNKTKDYLKKINKEKEKLLIEYNSYLEQYNQYKEKHGKSKNRWLKSGYKRENIDTNIEKLNKKLQELTVKISEFNNLNKHNETILKNIGKVTIYKDIDFSSLDNLIKESKELEDIRKMNERNKEIKKFLPFQYDTIRYQEMLNIKRKYKEWIREIDRFGLSKNKKDLEKLLTQCRDFEIYNEYLILDKESKKRKLYLQEINEIKKEIEHDKEKIIEMSRKKNSCLIEKEKISNQIKELNKKKHYRCPNCKENIYITDSGEIKLGKVDMLDNLKKRLNEVEEELKTHNRNEKLESNIINFEKEIKSIEEDIAKSKDKYPEPKKELSKINNPFPGKNIDKMIDIIINLINTYIEDVDESDFLELENGESLAKILGNYFEDYVKNPKKYKPEDEKRYLSKYNELQDRINNVRNKHEHNLKAKKEIQLLEKSFKDNSNKLEKLNLDENYDDELKSIKNKLENLQELKIDHIHYKELNDKNIKLKDYEKKIEEYDKNISITSEIYEKLKCISIEPLEDLINSLNFKINKFLDFLFEDTIPIQIVFSLYKPINNKKESKEKITINMKVYHGDCQYTNINLLSGGESDRISLAATLAISSMANSPFLFLDECMASLNCELREKCLTLVKNFCDDDKIIIDVCHESVEGYHDYIVKIDN